LTTGTEKFTYSATGTEVPSQATEGSWLVFDFTVCLGCMRLLDAASLPVVGAWMSPHNEADAEFESAATTFSGVASTTSLARASDGT
jgi:hypothetical protein